MGEPIRLLYPNQWLQESVDHQFSSIPLYDDKGILLSNVADLFLTLYDEGAPTDEVINGLNRVSIKNTSRYKFTAGQFSLTLTHDDLAIAAEATGRYTRRNALVEYSYGTGGAKIGTQEWYFVVRHVDRFPAVVP